MYSYRKYVKSIEYAWAESHLNKAEGILKKNVTSQWYELWSTNLHEVHASGVSSGLANPASEGAALKKVAFWRFVQRIGKIIGASNLPT